MIAMSMLAIAMVICLFGGYVEAPNAPACSRHQNHSPKADSQTSRRKEMMVTNTNSGPIARWNFSLWFALLSPIIGVLLGFLGLFLIYH
jgi:hypothetical protein